ncbi:thioesterase domain-containing protein, partial [Streptomyces boncukensis]
APRARVVPFHEPGDGGPDGHRPPPLYCLHGETGELTWLTHHAPVLARGGAVLGVEAPGFGAQDGAAPPGTVGEIADADAEAILGHRPQGPYRVAGFGLAAPVAAEVSRRLLDAGHEVTELVLLGADEPDAAVEAARAARAAGGAPVADVAGLFAEVWGAARPPRPSGGERDLPAAEAAALLGAAAGCPLPADRLSSWLEDAAAWRGGYLEALEQYAPRPLAGTTLATAVRGSAGAGGDWSRWIVPPPHTIDLPCSAASPASADAARALARHGSEETGGAPGRLLVPVNLQGDKAPTFWGHHLYGEVSYGVYLSRHLGLDYPFVGVEQVDMASRVHEFDSIEEMATRYIEEIRRSHPDVPYPLGGCSFGGVLAFEMARQLLLAGCEVPHLVAIDPIMPTTGAWDSIDWGAMTPEEVESLSVVILGNAYCIRWGVEEKIRLADIGGLELGEQLDVIARHIVARSARRPRHDAIAGQIRLKHEVLLRNNQLLVDYRPQPLPKPVDTTVFHATRGFLSPDNDNDLPEVKRSDDDRSNGFAEFVRGEVTVHDVEADHFEIAYDHNLRRIAERLRPLFDTL